MVPTLPLIGCFEVLAVFGGVTCHVWFGGSGVVIGRGSTILRVRPIFLVFFFRSLLELRFFEDFWPLEVGMN